MKTAQDIRDERWKQLMEFIEIRVGSELLNRYRQHIPMEATADRVDRKTAIRNALASGHISLDEVDLMTEAMDAAADSMPSPIIEPRQPVVKRRLKNMFGRRKGKR